MIVGRTKPEIYALRLYQIEREGFSSSFLYRVRSLEGDTPPNFNVLFSIVFKNEAPTPLSDPQPLTLVPIWRHDGRFEVEFTSPRLVYPLGHSDQCVGHQGPGMVS
jgi:hypothetical protein